MIKKIKTMFASVLALGLIAGVGLAIAVPGQVSAADGVQEQIQKGVTAVDPGGSGDLEDLITTVINVLLFLIGVLSVIMIIYGGFRFVTSGGSAESVKSAKNTILYSIVGLVVAILAFAIVNFVLTSL